MVFVSDLADGAVVLPLAVIVLLLMGALGWWQGLAAWTISTGATFGAVFALKAAAIVLADGYGERAFSPSGHVAGACIVYGGVAVLLLRGVLPAALAVAPAAAVAAMVAYSRLTLQVHSIAEVLTGAAIGFTGIAVLVVLAGPRPRALTAPVLVLTGCTILLFHGLHLHSEEAIQYAFSPH